MSNPNEHKSYEREVRQESYNDVNGHTHTNVTRTEETVNGANAGSYQDGYVHSQVSAPRYQEETLAQRDNNNAARGLLLGILLTSVAALSAGILWFFTQHNNQVDAPVAPVVVPAPNIEPSAKANQPSEKETTIIKEPVLVPVPQQQLPSTPQPSSPAPDINITVPSPTPKPPAGQTPSTQTSSTPPPNQKSSTTDRETQSAPTTKTPDQGTQSDTTTRTQDPGTPSQTDATASSDSASTGESSTSGSAQ